MRLSDKILASLLIVLALGLAASGWLASTSDRALLRQGAEDQGASIAAAVAASGIGPMLGEESPVLDQVLERLAHNENAVLSIDVISDGRIVSSYQKAGRESEPRRFFDSLIQTASAPGSTSRHLGRVRVGLSDLDFERRLTARVRNAALWNLLVFAALFVTLVLLIRRVVLRKVEKLRLHATRLGAGDLETRIDLGCDDELGALGSTLNDMAANLLDSRRHIEEQNQELLQLDRMKDDFLSNTSHELKTPLNGIIGLLESIEAGRYGDVPEKARPPLDMIRRSGERLLEQVESLLDFTRLIHGERVPTEPTTVSEVSLADVVNDIVSIFEYACTENDVTIDVSVDDSHVVEAPRRNVYSILENLISNAVKFTHEGTITVSSEPIEDAEAECVGYRVAVRDTGIGIPEDKQDRIFDSFYQAFRSEDRGYDGAGLGLAIVKLAVGSLGGRLELESREGQGSLFSVAIPMRPDVDLEGLAGGEAAPPWSECRSRPWTVTAPESGTLASPSRLETCGAESSEESRPRILVVDDDAINVEVLRSKLAPRFDVLTADGGAECLEILEARSVDLVLLDIMMPGVSGFDVLERLRSMAHVPVICVSARDQVGTIRRAMSLGAVDYVTKPFREEELLVRIETHLQLRRAVVMAEESARVRNEFLAAMSHEMRTPLNVVLGMTDLALDSDISDEPRSHLQAVLAQAEALCAMVDDILLYSHIESGRVHAKRTPFSLYELVNRVALSTTRSTEEKGLTFDRVTDREVPDAVIGDPVRLEQVLSKLVENALKFTNEGGLELKVELQESSVDRAVVKLSVRDTGIGIGAEHRHMIFEPFRQADGSLKRPFGGIGLGLAVTAELVRIMNGRIWLESEPGEGSVFHFTVDLGLVHASAPASAG